MKMKAVVVLFICVTALSFPLIQDDQDQDQAEDKNIKIAEESITDRFAAMIEAGAGEGEGVNGISFANAEALKVLIDGLLITNSAAQSQCAEQVIALEEEKIKYLDEAAMLTDFQEYVGGMWCGDSGADSLGDKELNDFITQHSDDWAPSQDFITSNCQSLKDEQAHLESVKQLVMDLAGEEATDAPTYAPTDVPTDAPTDAPTGALETCDDGVLNQDEDFIDCGGVCDPCDFTKFAGQDCTGDSDDLLREWVGTEEQCITKCSELNCPGFIRVNSGTFAGKCFFRGGTLSSPSLSSGDDRDCYVSAGGPWRITQQNCNCGNPRLYHEATGYETPEKCGQLCAQVEGCVSFGVWTGYQSKMCALWDQLCPKECPESLKTASNNGWGNDVYHMNGKDTMSDWTRWTLHEGKSCQTYAGGDSKGRTLEDSKIACLANSACVAIVCVAGSQTSCTLRGLANLVDYAPEDCYVKSATWSVLVREKNNYQGNCNCGERIKTEVNTNAEKCGAACAATPGCVSFGMYDKQAAGMCVLWDTKCTLPCPVPTNIAANYTNLLFNMETNLKKIPCATGYSTAWSQEHTQFGLERGKHVKACAPGQACKNKAECSKFCSEALGGAYIDYAGPGSCRCYSNAQRVGLSLTGSGWEMCPIEGWVLAGEGNFVYLGPGGCRDGDGEQFDRMCVKEGGMTQMGCESAASAYTESIAYSGNFGGAGYCCIFFDDGAAPSEPDGWSVTATGIGKAGSITANGVSGYFCYVRGDGIEI